MNSFRTEIIPKKSSFHVDYHKKIVFVGSCFTENVGNKLLTYKFPALVNPFGVLYNPLSVKKAFDLIISKKTFTSDDLSFENEKWFSFEHHSSFSSPDQNTVLKSINNKIKQSHIFLKEADILFITFGTSWYYELIDSTKLVANCHKLPANLFDRKILDANRIVTEWNKFLEQIEKFNPNLKIVFTVSPIRHWKDGAENNQLSKSILIVAIHEILKKSENTSYFPAYELMMDDLRDYRFYSDDFLHPNTQAINYIWNKFKSTYIDEKSLQILKEVEKILKALNHKPFQTQTQSYKDFLKVNIKKINKLKSAHPFIDLSTEIDELQKRLDKNFG